MGKYWPTIMDGQRHDRERNNLSLLLRPYGWMGWNGKEWLIAVVAVLAPSSGGYDTKLHVAGCRRTTVRSDGRYYALSMVQNKHTHPVMDLQMKTILVCYCGGPWIHLTSGKGKCSSKTCNAT